jgi:hypothetical protein
LSVVFLYFSRPFNDGTSLSLSTFFYKGSPISKAIGTKKHILQLGDDEGCDNLPSTTKGKLTHAANTHGITDLHFNNPLTPSLP